MKNKDSMKNKIPVLREDAELIQLRMMADLEEVAGLINSLLDRHRGEIAPGGTVNPGCLVATGYQILKDEEVSDQPPIFWIMLSLFVMSRSRGWNIPMMSPEEVEKKLSPQALAAMQAAQTLSDKIIDQGNQ